MVVSIDTEYPILVIPAMQDNLIYLLAGADSHCAVIDPGVADPVLDVLEQKRLTLTHILLTHNHADHTGGVMVLKKKTGCEVLGTDSRRTPEMDSVVRDNQVIRICGFQIRVIATPGHTSSSVCYYLQPDGSDKGAIFTGDTLFICGCGRLFECTAKQMFGSLQCLAELPEDTRLFPGHDYTMDNIQFALTVDPDNAALRQQLDVLNQKGSPAAIPSSIGFEKQTNPFLRTQSPDIRRNLKVSDAPDWQVFAELRRRKDEF
ncbi:MAG: hydroxyacylglutathione hydrolase [Anaerohalosphaeraceae bacterium]